MQHEKSGSGGSEMRKARERHDQRGRNQSACRPSQEQKERFQEEKAAHLAPLHSQRAHGSYFPGPLVQNDAEGIDDPHDNDEKEYEKDDEGQPIDGADDLRKLEPAKNIVDGGDPIPCSLIASLARLPHEVLKHRTHGVLIVLLEHCPHGTPRRDFGSGREECDFPGESPGKLRSRGVGCRGIAQEDAKLLIRVGGKVLQRVHVGPVRIGRKGGGQPRIMADRGNKKLSDVHLAGCRAQLHQHRVPHLRLEPVGRLLADDDSAGALHPVEAAGHKS